MIYMSHILDAYINGMAGSDEQRAFAKRLDSEGSIVDDRDGLMDVLEADFISFALSEPSPIALNERRIAFVAVASFIDSFMTAHKQFLAGKHPSQQVDGGAPG